MLRLLRLKRKRAQLERARRKAEFNERVFLDADDNPIENNWHHEEWFELMELHKYLLLPAAREHAKTEIGVKCNALFEMGVDPNIRILIISDVSEKAEDRTRLIRLHIERGTAYQQEFPNVKIASKDGDHSFTLVRDKILKEPTVTSTYAGSAISGGRYDLIVCDDLVNLLKNSYTPEQRKKIHQWFYRDVMNSLAKGGKLLMLGTPQHHDDLHADVAKDTRFHVVSYPGVDEEDTGFGNLGYEERNRARGITGLDAICLWPAMHSHATHMAKKENDYDTFLSQQQLQSVPSSGLVYRRPLVDAAFERGKRVSYNPSAAQFVSIDPGYAKRAAMLCVQETAGDRIELWAEHSFTQIAPDDVAEVVAEHCLNHNVLVCFYDAEDVGFGAMLEKALRQRRAATRVQPVPFNRYKRLSIAATRWLLQSDRVAWRGDVTTVHTPGKVQVVPSIFRAEVRDYALKEGTDDEAMKNDDHGPDSWAAYASRWIAAWAQATNRAA